MDDEREWAVIEDRMVRHIWKDVKGVEIDVPPTWYEANGTPIDDEGVDMKYVRTETRQPRKD